MGGLDMKKIIGVFVLAMFILFTYGCSVESKVEYLTNRSIQYDDAGRYHTLFFTLTDKKDKVVKSPARIDVRIVNDSKQTVYSKSVDIDKDDYGKWSSKLAGDQILASIRISDSEIQKGDSSDGTLYFKVSLSNGVYFEESSLSVYNLPFTSVAEKTSIKLPVVPLEYKGFGWSSNVTERFQITSIRSEIEGSYDNKTVSITLFIAGEKTYDYFGNNNSSIGLVAYKLIDKEGYVVDSGNFYVNQVKVGEKFRDAKAIIYSIQPGEYELVIGE